VRVVGAALEKAEQCYTAGLKTSNGLMFEWKGDADARLVLLQMCRHTQSGHSSLHSCLQQTFWSGLPVKQKLHIKAHGCCCEYFKKLFSLLVNCQWQYIPHRGDCPEFIHITDKNRLETSKKGVNWREILCLWIYSLFIYLFIYFLVYLKLINSIIK